MKTCDNFEELFWYHQGKTGLLWDVAHFGPWYLTTELQGMFGVELEDLQDYRARHPLHASYFLSPQTEKLEAAKAHARKQHEAWLASQAEEE